MTPELSIFIAQKMSDYRIKISEKFDDVIPDIERYRKEYLPMSRTLDRFVDFVTSHNLSSIGDIPKEFDEIIR